MRWPIVFKAELWVHNEEQCIAVFVLFKLFLYSLMLQRFVEHDDVLCRVILTVVTLIWMV